MIDKKYMTTAEVAAHLRVTPRTVQLWAKSGQLPSVRIGRSLRFPVDELASLLQQLSK